MKKNMFGAHCSLVLCKFSGNRFLMLLHCIAFDSMFIVSDVGPQLVGHSGLVDALGTSKCCGFPVFQQAVPFSSWPQRTSWW